SIQGRPGGIDDPLPFKSLVFVDSAHCRDHGSRIRFAVENQTAEVTGGMAASRAEGRQKTKGGRLPAKSIAGFLYSLLKAF
ncbi:hypothetical protein, partial [Caldibacillus debilis]|uniref:hypothetical protein n=1 Tax=Caldibacillus debilis TaxID=301148 RepID=UPI0023F3FFAA